MTTNQDARAAESVALREAIRGVTSVSFGLLRECLGPLEVSAALIESDDSEQLDALIDKVKAALAVYDAAQPEPAVVAESAEQRAVPERDAFITAYRSADPSALLSEAQRAWDGVAGCMWRHRASLAAAPAAQQAAPSNLQLREGGE